MVKNVMLIVWDAARYDYVQQHAPNLTSLAEDNVSFTQAIAPSGWSIPSHVSMFTGQRPVEHGQYRMDQQITSLPLFEQINEAYTTYGISANIFLSPKHGFDEFFDKFYGTNLGILFPEAFNPLQTVKPGSDASEASPWEVIKSAISSEKKIKSFLNVGFSGTLSLLSNMDPPFSHRWFSDYPGFNYDPQKNIDCIRSVLEKHSSSGDPFFSFANFFETHHPYSPPRELQSKHLGRVLSHGELEELAELSNPFNFLEAMMNSCVDEEKIQTIQALYAAEVEASDSNLLTVMKNLESAGLRENTLVLVVGDHGENLGEVGPFGDPMMGHERSGSHPNHHVPLVAIHPDLDGTTIESPFNVRHIFDIIKNKENFVRSPENFLSEYTGREVISQTPVSRSAALQDTHPAIPDRIINRNIVVGYKGDWRVVVSDQDKSKAYYRSQETPIEQAPSQLVSNLEESLDRMDQHAHSEDLDEDAKERLQRLGYL